MEGVQCCNVQLLPQTVMSVFVGDTEESWQASAETPPCFLGYFGVSLLLTGAADEHTGESSLYHLMAVSLPVFLSQPHVQSAWDEQGSQSLALSEWHLSLVLPLAVGLYQFSLSASSDLWHLLMLRERRVRDESVIHFPGWDCRFYQAHYLLSSLMCSFDNSDILGPFKVVERVSDSYSVQWHNGSTSWIFCLS